LDIDLWIKRDDLTGFALGGNKGRKLEFLMGDVLKHGAEVVVSCGAAQSNFIRQLGAACSMLGVRCSAVVMDLPYEPEYGKPQGSHLSPQGGNVSIDAMLGVETTLLPDGSWDDLFEATENAALQLEAEGCSVYRIPIGGSSPLGALGFVDAAIELQSQCDPFDTIVVASSSGSTQAGLSYRFAGTSTRVTGISCDPEPDLLGTLSELCAGLDSRLGGSQSLKSSDFDLRFDWVGAGYGVPSEGSIHAIKKLAQTEGIFLDPIYSGKAFDGLLGLVAAKELKGRVLFWHTGGVPTLFALQSPI
jgi:1-aminocyclopropane-1-carboxylate deaminase/D-cysteine desulfhydrase-like pyridoxal-dependent ACC family enzyme